MGKKNDLDIQTFQIYQDEETHDHPAEEAAPPKKKKFSMASFKKKEKVANAVDADDSGTDSPSDSISVNQGGDKSAIIKGLAIGIVIVILVVVVDQLL